MAKDKKFQFDDFGNMIVWLPFGTPTIIEDYGHGSYVVTKAEIENTESNRSLAGIDITVWHPLDEEGNQTFVNPDNYNDVTVGTSLGEYRIVNNVGEVKCLIKNKVAQGLVQANLVSETSPCYLSQNGIRTYNHLSMIPEGYARGGRKMIIKTEGKTMDTKELAELTSTKVVDAIKTMMAEGEDQTKAFEAEIKKAKEEGFAEGLAASKYFNLANKLGFEGEDINLAKDHILKTKFPKKSFEGAEEVVKISFLEAAMCMTDSGEEEEENMESKNCEGKKTESKKTESKLPKDVKVESYDAAKIIASKFWKPTKK